VSGGTNVRGFAILANILSKKICNACKHQKCTHTFAGMESNLPGESARKIRTADLQHFVGAPEFEILKYLTSIGFVDDQPFNDYVFRLKCADTKQMVAGRVSIDDNGVIINSVEVYDVTGFDFDKPSNITPEMIVKHLYDLAQDNPENK
jgi:hypothetical protein